VGMSSINLIRPAAHQALGDHTPARETQDSRDDGFDSLFSQSNFEKLGREFCASNTIAGLGERENKQRGQIVSMHCLHLSSRKTESSSQNSYKN
jgi:hypothetical protein